MKAWLAGFFLDWGGCGQTLMVVFVGKRRLKRVYRVSLVDTGVEYRSGESRCDGVE